MIIKRELEEQIRQRLFKGKAIIIYGPRQSGKTTLVEQVTGEYSESTLFLSGDEPDVRELLSGVTSTRLQAFFGRKRLVVIDEAQRIPGIGRLTAESLTTEGIENTEKGGNKSKLLSEFLCALCGENHYSSPSRATWRAKASSCSRLRTSLSILAALVSRRALEMAAEGAKFAEVMAKVTEKIRKLGPNTQMVKTIWKQTE